MYLFFCRFGLNSTLIQNCWLLLYVDTLPVWFFKLLHIYWCSVSTSTRLTIIIITTSTIINYFNLTHSKEVWNVIIWKSQFKVRHCLILPTCVKFSQSTYITLWPLVAYVVHLCLLLTGFKAREVWQVFWKKLCMSFTYVDNALFFLLFTFSSVHLFSHVQFFASPWTAACQSIIISQSLFKLTSIKLVMPSNHLILCCPLFILPSIFPSIRVFSNESVLHIRWPKY